MNQKISSVIKKNGAPIGLIGKLYVRDNSKCVVGNKCECQNGIAVPENK